MKLPSDQSQYEVKDLFPEEITVAQQNIIHSHNMSLVVFCPSFSLLGFNLSSSAVRKSFGETHSSQVKRAVGGVD